MRTGPLLVLMVVTPIVTAAADDRWAEVSPLGRAIPWHVAGLRREGRLRLSELNTLDAQSPYYTNRGARGRFDAQSWGVIHYLLFGRPDDRTADRRAAPRDRGAARVVPARAVALAARETRSAQSRR